MKVLIVSQWFPPEQSPFGYMMKELAQGLLLKGHDVTVVTAFPNHPGGEVFGGYNKKWVLRETIDGVKVIRVWLGTSSNRSPFMRLYTFISFTVTSSIAVLRQKNIDVIFAVFQPLSVGLTLPLIAKFRRAKLVLNIQDLHPDVPIELGLVRGRFLKWVLRCVEKYGYRNADALTVICESFKRHCVTRGAMPEVVKVIPNWIDLNEIKPRSRINAFRCAAGLADEDYVVLYAGTLGYVSGAEVVLSAARELSNLPEVRFVFVGGGAMFEELQRMAAKDRLTNVIFAPFQPRDVLGDVQAISDVSVVTLGAGKGKNSVPSKVLGYMAAARPIVASVDCDSETALTISAAKCGRVVEPGSGEKLAEAILKFKGDSELSRTLASNGRLFLERHYSRQDIVDQYSMFFEQIVF